MIRKQFLQQAGTINCKIKDTSPNILHTLQAYTIHNELPAHTNRESIIPVLYTHIYTSIITLCALRILTLCQGHSRVNTHGVFHPWVGGGGWGSPVSYLTHWIFHPWGGEYFTPPCTHTGLTYTTQWGLSPTG